MKNKFNKEAFRKLGFDMLFIIAGCAAGAFASICIMVPNGLSSGGITGLVRILQKFVGIDFSVMYYGFAMVILIICWIVLGFGEARKIILLTIVYPAFLFLFEQFDFTLLEESDLILAAIYCGVFSGACTGLVLSRGYSFGGTDTVAKILKKKVLPHVGISKILLVIDAVIIIASGVFYGRNIALYALINQVILTKVAEIVIYGFDTKVVQLEILSEEWKAIASYIMEEIQRGVTEAQVLGGYTGETKKKLITLCSPRESILIKQHVAKIDPAAFVTVIRVETVWGRGEGFSDITEKES